MPTDMLKQHRARLLTAEDPAMVRRRLVEAFDAFATLPAPAADHAVRRMAA
jgi:hypothetical protein